MMIKKIFFLLVPVFFVQTLTFAYDADNPKDIYFYNYPTVCSGSTKAVVVNKKIKSISIMNPNSTRPEIYFKTNDNVLYKIWGGYYVYNKKKNNPDLLDLSQETWMSYYMIELLDFYSSPSKEINICYSVLNKINYAYLIYDRNSEHYVDNPYVIRHLATEPPSAS